MKKILVVIPSFQHGGTNRSFTNMLDLFDFKSHDFEVDLLCIKSAKEGPYYEEYSKREINILQNNKLLVSIFGQQRNILNRFVRQSFSKFSLDMQDWVLESVCRKYSYKYDCVVAMEEGITTRIASYIITKQRIAWIRSMFDSYCKYTNMEHEKQCYSKFDQIVCVTSACRDDYIKYIPEKSEDVVVINNTQNVESILNKSKEMPNTLFSEDYINIVSIGRLDIVKRFDRIPEITYDLLRLGHAVRWYIIGEGNERDNITQKIHTLGVDNNVILLGQIDNPYPYLYMADFAAVTSSSESFCNVIVEAGIVDTPVISTDFPAVYETVKYAKNVTICKIEEFSLTIDRLCKDKKNRQKKIDERSNKNDPHITAYIKQLEELFCGE